MLLRELSNGIRIPVLGSLDRASKVSELDDVGLQLLVIRLAKLAL